MNILKPSELIEKSEYQKVYYHLSFDDLFKKILSGINSYRFFEITKPDANHISFKPKNDYFQYSNLSGLSQLLDEGLNSILLDMQGIKTFHIKHKKKILCYLHIDWILALQQLKMTDLHSQKLIDYLQFETGSSNIAKKVNHINGTAESRSNIYTTNQDSVIVNLIDLSLSKNTKKLNKINYNLILSNPLLSFIEISSGFDNEKLTTFLSIIDEYNNKIFLNHEISNDMKFSLKLRKIKRTNKKGMFIVNQNSILLDPRHVDSFSHELGHWYHTWFKKEIIDEKQAEEFASAFMKEFK